MTFCVCCVQQVQQVGLFLHPEMYFLLILDEVGNRFGQKGMFSTNSQWKQGCGTELEWDVLSSSAGKQSG